jgi:hypothetical protein
VAVPRLRPWTLSISTHSRCVCPRTAACPHPPQLRTAQSPPSSVLNSLFPAPASVMSTTTHPAYPLTALCCAQALAFCELAMQLPVGTPAATNVAGILGCLGQFPSVALARPEIAEALVRLLGDGLDGLGEGGGDPWLTAEALNSVFDVFAGDSRGACQPPFQCWSFPSVHFFCYVVENYVCVISSSHILLLLCYLVQNPNRMPRRMALA